MPRDHGDPRGVGVSYERGTPVDSQTGGFAGNLTRNLVNISASQMSSHRELLG